MAQAEVGDDVYGEDPTVNALEHAIAERLGFAAGLFVPSGTQSNLCALLAHCGRGDEFIAGHEAHTYLYEGGGAAVLGGIQPQTLPFGADGTLDLAAIRAAIKPDDAHFARTRLLCLENTQGGKPLPPGYLKAARALCDAHGLRLHLDGARLFNAALASECAAADIAATAHSVSVCFSKGLGAPVGSALVGDAPFIQCARRWRKMLGGGMRQAGVLAAAALHALSHHVGRLAEDHARAERLAAGLSDLGHSVAQHTNMVFVGPALAGAGAALAARGIRIEDERWVLHLDVDDAGVAAVLAAVKSLPAPRSPP